jgi:hypothetical protein
LEQILLFKKNLKIKDSPSTNDCKFEMERMGMVYRERGCGMLILKWENVENYNLNN